MAVTTTGVVCTCPAGLAHAVRPAFGGRRLTSVCSKRFAYVASSGKKRISLSETFGAGVGPFPVDLSRQRARSDLSDRRGCPLIQTCLRRAAPSMAPFRALLQQVGARVRVRAALRANTCGSRHKISREMLVVRRTARTTRTSAEHVARPASTNARTLRRVVRGPGVVHARASGTCSRAPRSMDRGPALRATSASPRGPSEPGAAGLRAVPDDRADRS